jgi:hypothetical protein
MQETQIGNSYNAKARQQDETLAKLSDQRFKKN